MLLIVSRMYEIAQSGFLIKVMRKVVWELRVVFYLVETIWNPGLKIVLWFVYDTVVWKMLKIQSDGGFMPMNLVLNVKF